MLTTHFALFSFFNGMSGRAPAPVTVATATPGFIRHLPPLGLPHGESDEAKKARRGELESRAPQDDGRLAEYTEKSAKLAAAVSRLRSETAQFTDEADAIRAQIAALEGQKRAKALAKAERDLMLKEQALTLARAQETALLEEIEMLDVAYVAMIALALVMQ